MLGRKRNHNERIKTCRVVSNPQFVKRAAQSEEDRQGSSPGNQLDGRPAAAKKLWPFYQEESVK